MFKKNGQKVFNEAAFDRGACLYDGEIDGHAFRHVAKSFQVKVWDDLNQSWSELSTQAKMQVQNVLPGHHGFRSDVT